VAISPRDLSARRLVLISSGMRGCVHAPSCRMAPHRRGAHHVLDYQRRRARGMATVHRRTCWYGFRAHSCRRACEESPWMVPPRGERSADHQTGMAATGNLGRRDEAGEWRRLPACWAAKREPRASFAEAHRDALGFLPRPISARTSPRSAPVPLALCCLLPGGPMPRPEISLFSFSLHRSYRGLKFLVMLNHFIPYLHVFYRDFLGRRLVHRPPLTNAMDCCSSQGKAMPCSQTL